MVIKGNPAGNVMFWSKHLQREDTNERVTVKEITGVTAGNLQDALWEMKWVAAGSRSQGNFMYQANINPLAHEHLTDAQWREAVDTLEKNLGLEGHQRVVVEHVKEGRQHYHVIWNRVDAETMRVADMGGNYRIHTATARELENRFELTRVPDPGQKQRSARELYEYRAADRSGIDPAAVTKEVTALWQSTDSGKAFAAALDQQGYVLCKGDRRDFCIVDRAGDAHSLARRIDGVTVADLRARMSDIDREALPTVLEASAHQRGHDLKARQSAREDIRLAYTESATPERFQAVLAEKGYVLARADVEDVERSKADQSHAATRGEYRPAMKEGQIVAVSEAGWVYSLNQSTTGDRPKDVAVFLSDLDRETLPAISEIVDERKQSREIGSDDRSMGETLGHSMGAALAVVDGVTNVVERVTEFVTDFLSGTSPPLVRSPSEEIIAARKARAALGNIRDSLERGEALDADDVRNLLPEHLNRIRDRGDDYLRALASQVTQEQQRRRDEGWERER